MTDKGETKPGETQTQATGSGNEARGISSAFESAHAKASGLAGETVAEVRKRLSSVKIDFPQSAEAVKSKLAASPLVQGMTQLDPNSSVSKLVSRVQENVVGGLNKIDPKEPVAKALNTAQEKIVAGLNRVDPKDQLTKGYHVSRTVLGKASVAVVEGLNYVDPKRSVPKMLNAAEEAMIGEKPVWVGGLNALEHLKQPRTVPGRVFDWYHRRYIARNSIAPVFHMIGIGLVTGLFLKKHFMEREYNYVKMVKKLEGFSDHDATVAAKQAIFNAH